jgi:hypothetical protein
MIPPDTDNKQTTETLEHLLNVVAENREKRCAEVTGRTLTQAEEILKQAHSRVRTRLHRHILILRDKYRVSVSAAQARNQTLIRQQHQKADSEFLDAAWPILRESLLALWRAPASRQIWIDTAIANASSTLLDHDWCIEYPRDFTEEEHEHLKQTATNKHGEEAKLAAGDDIRAGIRIIGHGTVLDATLEGLLQQKTAISAILIARIKQDTCSHD